MGFLWLATKGHVSCTLGKYIHMQMYNGNKT